MSSYVVRETHHVTSCVFVSFSRILLLMILIFKGFTARRLYKSFDVKGLILSIRVLPSVCAILSYMLNAELFHPVLIPHRKHALYFVLHARRSFVSLVVGCASQVTRV
jgi:hypothetical protein